MNLSNEKKGIIFAVGFIAVVAIIGFIFFTIANPSPEKKYGTEAVEDGKAAIFTADQYLDGKLSSFEYRIQLGVYQKETGYTQNSKIIYQTINYMSYTSTDASVLEYRNELAELIGEDKR